MASARHIVVVDDEPMIHLITDRVLTRAGFVCLHAGDGAEALERLAGLAEPPCLVITDIRMPGMDGWELGRRLGELHPALPVLYISAHHSQPPDLPPGHVTRHFLAKPFSVDVLLHKVRELCRAGPE
jgi:CheY-like chemotaxis protein